mmetsp:Transcript_11135/g.26142  ORF Transcript_11135/g.26142 Transcript_11135/m.26142 type:complete len:133 (-) Transcript_11135:388-786(-)
MASKLGLAVILAFVSQASGFAPTKPRAARSATRVSGFLDNFKKELDNFVDDATSRRLGNGAAFYGKRKSTFYGEQDFMKKADSDVADASEDYQGPTNSGYFVWRKDDEGGMQAQTRLRGKALDRFIKPNDDT